MAGEEYGALASHQFYNLSYSQAPQVPLRYDTSEKKAGLPLLFTVPRFFYYSVVQFATMVIRQIETASIKIRANLS